MKPLQRWPQSFDSKEQEEQDREPVFKIHSYRSQQNAQSSSPPAINRIKVVDCPLIQTDGESVTVKITRQPRKDNHLSRRMPAKQKPTSEDNDFMSDTISPSDAVYTGGCGSPHIKPKYMQHRLMNHRHRNYGLSSRRASSTVNEGFVPKVQGIAIMQPSLQLTNMSTNREDESVRNSRPLQQLRPPRQERSINNDIQEAVDLQPLYEHPSTQPPNFIARGYQAKRLCRPITQPRVGPNDTMGYKIHENLGQHRLQVNMTDDRISFKENDGKSTVQGFDSPKKLHYQSPTRILFQQSNHKKNKKLTASRQQLKRQSEIIRGNGIYYGSKHSSHVQLTDLLKAKNKELRQQKMQTHIAELLVEAQQNEQQFPMPQLELTSRHNSQDLTSVISQEGKLTGKITDYNVVSPNILLPKLNDGQGDLVNFPDGHATVQITKNKPAEEFNQLNNCATRSEAEPRSGEFDIVTQPPMLNMMKTKSQMPGQQQPITVPLTHRVIDRMYGQYARGKILIQKGEYPSDQNISHTVTVCSEESSVSIASNKYMRTKSMPNAKRQNRFHRKIQLRQAANPVIHNQEEFLVEAQPKQVVCNVRAKQQNQARKINVISNNEQMRQQNALNALNMTKPVPAPPVDGSLQNDTQPLQVVKQKTELVTDMSINEGDEEIELLVDSATPLRQNESDSPTLLQLQHHSFVSDMRQVYQLQQKGEEQGITTANATSHSVSRKIIESPLEHSQQLLSHIASQGSQCNKSGLNEIEKSSPGHRSSKSKAVSGIIAASFDDANQIVISSGQLNGLEPKYCYVEIQPDSSSSRVFNQKTLPFPQAKPKTAVSSPRVKGTTTAKPMTAAASLSPRNRPQIIIQSSIQDYCGASAVETTDNMLVSEQASYRSSSKKVSSTMNPASQRAVWHRPRQMNDIFNLGDLQSLNMKGIKVSRLKDLGQKQQVGNPLHKFNQLQQQLNEKNQTLQSGGDLTKELVTKHVQEQWQTEAIQDFACHKSRFNSPKENKSSLISIKKLIARHPRLSVHEDKSPDIAISDTTSRDSYEQRFQVNMMHQIINETKSTSPQIVPDNQPILRKSKAPSTVVEVVLSENDTLLDDQSAKHGDSSLTIRSNVNQQLLFCKKIKLKQKSTIAQEILSKKPPGFLDIVQRRSVELAKTSCRSSNAQRNGSGTAGADRQNRKARNCKKDTADMLYDDIDYVGVKSTSDNQGDQDEEMSSGEEQDTPCIEGGIMLDGSQMKKLESSDVEVYLSRSLMDPMGREVPLTACVVESKLTEMSDQRPSAKPKISGKLQVYSVYEGSGEDVSTRKSLEPEQPTEEKISSPAISVMAVKIQNSRNSRGLGIGEQQDSTLMEMKGNSLIKHVDQSLELPQEELEPGLDTIVRYSYQNSSKQTDPELKEQSERIALQTRIFQKRSTHEAANEKHPNQIKSNKSSLLQCDFLEQFNAVNTVLAPNIGNGYHQLESKLFSSATLENENKMIARQITPLTIGSSLKFSVVSKSLMNKFNSRRIATPQQRQYPAMEESEDPGYIRHAALENRLRSNRMNKGLIELRKREQVKHGKAEVLTGQILAANQSLASEQQLHGASLISSQQFSLEQRDVVSETSNAAVQTTPKVHHSPRMPTRDIESLQKSHHIEENEDKESKKIDVELQQLRKVEKDITKCINIEKLLKRPISEVYDALQDYVGALDNEIDDGNLTFKPKRRGVMKLSSRQVADLYRDHFFYEFPEYELHSLLGEDVMSMKDTNRRYFLQFSGLQIVNVDCQSGLICDTEPLVLPMSKMINLFFLSCDQLQQVLSQSIRLVGKEDNQLMLYLDQAILRSKLRKIVPQIIREDYFSATLQVSITEAVAEQCNMIKDSFNLEIRMPRLEIVTTAPEFQNDFDPLFKTTMTHNLTGRQMMTILQNYHLIEWATFAKKLIKERTFGADSSFQTDLDTIKLQRLLANGFVPYKDPEQLKQERAVAQNLQLTMLIKEKFTMQISFLRPIKCKLLIDSDSKQDALHDPSYQHLSGYLPESSSVKDQKPGEKTIASVQIPMTRLPFLKQVFGANIEDSSDGCLLECLYDLVELHLDTNCGIMKLEIPSWRRLEEINMHKLSQKYFDDKLVTSETQCKNLMYKGTRVGREDLKAMLKSGGDSYQLQMPVFNQDQSCIQHSSSVQDTNTCTPAAATLNEQVANSAILSQVPNQQQSTKHPEKLKQRRFQLNDMVCKLKIGRLDKAVYAQDFVYQNARCDSVKQSESHHKVTLAEYFRSIPPQ